MDTPTKPFQTVGYGRLAYLLQPKKLDVEQILLSAKNI